jgi:hypothetical protein
MVKKSDLPSIQVYNWLIGYAKMIEDKHPGITWGYETDDNTWCIFSKQRTLLIQVGFDLKNKELIYSYLTDIGGKLDLKSGKTKELKDLKILLPKLEEIDAFNK